jgi:hypothetical protein
MNRLPDRSHAACLLSDNLNLRRRTPAGTSSGNLGGVDATDAENNCETDLIKYPPPWG